MRKIFVSAVQMECVLGDVDKNLCLAEKFINEAIKKESSIVVLPELFNTGYDVSEHDFELAEEVPGYTSKFLSNIAKSNDIYIVAAILEKSNLKGIIYDTELLIAPNGSIQRYRKNLLWDKEKVRFMQGTELPIWKTEKFILGPQICYEVGFPERARELCLKGADILLYSSAFGKARYYAWDLATRSRALENGVYVIASNRSGNDNDVYFAGASRIIDPQGTVLIEATERNQLITAEIDLDFINQQRRNIPYLKDLLLYNMIKK